MWSCSGDLDPMKLDGGHLPSGEVDKVMEMPFGKGDELGALTKALPLFLREKGGEGIAEIPKFD